MVRLPDIRKATHMSTETDIFADLTVVVFIERHTGSVWEQGSDIKEAQFAIDRLGREFAQWSETDEADHAFAAYRAPLKSYGASDGGWVRRNGEFIGFYSNHPDIPKKKLKKMRGF
jgi:GTP-dependent phosphoenolpyruvate carboxykinase